MADNQNFTVKVVKATFLPDENAIREFIVELNQELAANEDLRNRWNDNPVSVLSDAGVALDLQRYILQANGVGGLAMVDCSLTCVESLTSVCSGDRATRIVTICVGAGATLHGVD